MNRKAEANGASLSTQLREATFVPASIDEEARTATLVWTTGAKVRRYDWWEDEVYEEELSLDPAHVRMDRLNGGAVPILKDHVQSVDNVVGTAISGELADGEGRAVARFDSGDEQADRLWRKVKSGMLGGISVGYRVYRYEVIRKEGKLPVYRATDWEPLEISLVAVPADAGAGFRSADDGIPCEIIDQTRAAQPCSAETTPNEETDMGMKTETRADDNKPAIDLDAVRAEAAAAERSRSLEIRKAVRSVGLEDAFADTLINSGKGIEQARADILEAVAAKSEKTEIRGSRIEVGHSYDDPAVLRGRMEEALAARFAPGLVKVTEQAREFANCSAIDMARDLIEARGERVRGKEAIASRALSTSDFPMLLANASNKVLLASYESAAPTYRQVAAERSFNDFKAHSFLRLGDFPSLEKVNEHGEFTNGKLSENRETVKADTYGRIVSVTRQMLINDDLGAFGDFARLAGIRVADFENRTVWELIASNPVLADGITLYHADHGNLAGAGSVISVTSVGAGRAALRKQTSLDGIKLNLAPRILAVSPDKETDAERFVASVLSTKGDDVNPFSGKLTVVSDANLTGNAWHLFADPNLAPVVVYGYVQGQRGPRLAMQDGFRMDGVEYRVAVDFAAGIIDHRGTYKNNG